MAEPNPPFALSALGVSLLLGACGGSPEPQTVEFEAGPCAYPEAVEPMTEGRTLYPYRWESAFNGAGLSQPLDLVEAPCDSEEWNPFDSLAFISIPAW